MRSEQVRRAARRDGRVLSNTDCVYGVWHTGDIRSGEAGGVPGTEPKVWLITPKGPWCGDQVPKV